MKGFLSRQPKLVLQPWKSILLSLKQQFRHFLRRPGNNGKESPCRLVGL